MGDFYTGIETDTATDIDNDIETDPDTDTDTDTDTDSIASVPDWPTKVVRQSDEHYKTILVTGHEINSWPCLLV